MARKDKPVYQDRINQQPFEEKKNWNKPVLLVIPFLGLVGILIWFFFSTKSLQADFKINQKIIPKIEIPYHGEVPKVNFESIAKKASHLEWSIVGRGTSLDTVIYDEVNFDLLFPETGNYQIILEVRNEDNQRDRQEKMLKIFLPETFKLKTRQELVELINTIANPSSASARTAAVEKLADLCIEDMTVNFSTKGQSVQQLIINDLILNLSQGPKGQLDIVGEITFNRRGLAAILNIEEEPLEQEKPIAQLMDRDFDGVADDQDRCPYESGLKSLRGCPDRDEDGIADRDDKCPDQKGEPKDKGCPKGTLTTKNGTTNTSTTTTDDTNDTGNIGSSTGGNGRQGEEDLTPAVVDSDQDGIVDEKDKCPQVKGSLINGGCPIENLVVATKEREKLAGEINEIFSIAESQDVADAERFVYDIILPQLSNKVKGTIVTKKGNEATKGKAGLERYLTDKIWEDVDVEIQKLEKDETGMYIKIKIKEI